ncbi:MAG: sigma 54-interacting transcriptional regulator [Thermodesulfobacteriota bacterium]
MEIGADRVLRDLTDHLLSPLCNLDRALEPILDLLDLLASAERAVVSLKNTHTERHIVWTSRKRADEGIPSSKASEYDLPPEMLRSAELVSATDATEEQLPQSENREMSTPEATKSFVEVPIVLRGTPVGAMRVYFPHEKREVVMDRVSLIEKIAQLVAQTLDLRQRITLWHEAHIAANTALKAEMLERVAHFLSHRETSPMGPILRLVRDAAESVAPILIQGEAGVGKTLAAHAIHELSDRRALPLVRINCLVHRHDPLRILDGLRSGTWASERIGSPGERTCRWTLLLSSVEAVSLSAQAEILSFLRRSMEMHDYPRGAACRIVATSRKDLAGEVRKGAFSPELYKRISTILIEIPPLRDRREDVLRLTQFFSTRVSKESGHNLTFTPRSLELLNRHIWPGNVTELENLVERMGFSGEDREIDVDDLSPFLSPALAPLDAVDNGSLDSLQRLEKRSVLSALERNKWIQARAAQDLGITMRQMGYRIKKYDLEGLVKKNRGHRRRERQAGSPLA